MKKLLCSLFALSAVSTAMAQEVNIKLLGTSDIHGRVVPWSYGADVEDKSGSYAQIATYVKDVRKNNKNVVLVDVGDAIQDNQVDVFAKDKKYYKDHPIPKVLNEMKYDVFVLGNHEFNFGMKALDEILKDIKAKKLTANFYYKKNDKRYIDATTIIEKDGVKLGIIGLSTPMSAKFEEDTGNLKDMKFTSPTEEARTQVEKLKAKGVDAIIVIAHMGIENENKIPKEELKEVSTPGTGTIEELCDFLKIPAENTAKAVVYQKNADDSYIVAFIRGDLDINETKLTNAVGEDIHPAVIEDDSILTAGFIGPVGISDKVTVYFDNSLEGIDYLVTGANKVDTHYTGFNVERDCPDAKYVDLAKITEGGICPNCGKPVINISRGIEVGNIFQLGTKYSKAMNFTYTDENGKEQYPIMGCYGIGVGRMAASICEVRHDDYGPIWPITIAPWQVHLCCLRSDDAECKEKADEIYETLQNMGIEVIYDDRKARPGAMFADADLLGVPVRVVVSPRNL
ncbi:MAG: metallophosphoesterase, partial [Haemophilus parainfluenzae]|nr:metallophosphoesterase [Haemophilus parainfluenzae]